ncbi:YbaK/EbsC family protein [Primorskyibacter sp. S87]|uniref:YbaK/EbsC family protein n=1 Tax=Primorskyibacter sp. S87 TaxID=3415126 RepID=UPI003C7A9D71
MSKSLKRVRAALEAAGVPPDIRETEGSRTAEDAAAAVGCHVDQIVKSIVFCGEDSGKAILFLTAGGNRVDADLAAECTGEALGKADAALIRSHTGFAIGGVSPIGQLTPIRSFLDPRLSDFDRVWAAAGTPRHVFSIAPDDLVRITGAASAKFTS